jgi:hypothetical protein
LDEKSNKCIKWIFTPNSGTTYNTNKNYILNLKILKIQILIKYLIIYFYWQVMQQTKAQREQNKTKQKDKRKEKKGRGRTGQVARMCGPICSKFEWCEKLHIYVVRFF